jgi:4-diphosphocytidyl-2-C-methyl-D-erythritol kinase
MDIRRDEFKRRVRAPAKLNMFLNLLGRRADGFHELETLMVPVQLADSLSFRPILSTGGKEPAEIRLNVREAWPVQSPLYGDPIPSGPENLVVKALQLFQQRSGCALGAEVELVKRVPAAAGLGGGSSDAAAALRLANRRWRIHWSGERLADLAAEIGSDVPFFLAGGPAICRGRGERTERLPPIRPLHFVLVKPPVGLNSGAVYGAYDARPDNRDEESDRNRGLAAFVAGLSRGKGFDVCRQMQNALQNAASSLSPWVDRLRMVFDELDFVGHQLSGSGSAYFGVCRHAHHARRLASILRTRQLGLVYATRSCQ